MKVKCIANKSCRYLTIGKEYTVYALGFFQDNLWYCICRDSKDDYPLYERFSDFEVIDPRLSRYWIFDRRPEGEPKVGANIAFPEWIEQEYFYSNLVDWEREELSVFGRYKDLMDLEFPCSSVTRSLQIGDESWLICPDCLDAWVCENTLDALIVCPMCEQVFNNPRYAQT